MEISQFALDYAVTIRHSTETPYMTSRAWNSIYLPRGLDNVFAAGDLWSTYQSLPKIRAVVSAFEY